MPRYVGVISYDEFCPEAIHKSPTLVYEIHDCLVWQKGEEKPRRLSTDKVKDCSLRLDERAFKDLQKAASEVDLKPIKGATLYSSLSDESYLSLVHDVQSSIRAGTYYQLNLLRWFKLAKHWNWQDVCARLAAHGGPFSVLFRHGNVAVASFSPERFVSIQPNTDKTMIETWPIKGTANRDLINRAHDDVIKEQLARSPKDRAELNMIIDLMRNDLHRVCIPGSVEVLDSGSVKTFSHVHHLEGHIRGVLSEERTMGDVLQALCPGGSITGAPKIEVMKHIHALEGRERGYMMGHSFLMDANGFFDSNILIRTMTSADGCRNWNYAAGSGIVVKSIAEQELLEVSSKCRPLTD